MDLVKKFAIIEELNEMQEFITIEGDEWRGRVYCRESQNRKGENEYENEYEIEKRVQKTLFEEWRRSKGERSQIVKLNG